MPREMIPQVKRSQLLPVVSSQAVLRGTWSPLRTSWTEAPKLPEIPGHLAPPALLEGLGAAFPAISGRIATNSGRKPRCDLERTSIGFIGSASFLVLVGAEGAGAFHNMSPINACLWNLPKCA